MHGCSHFPLAFVSSRCRFSSPSRFLASDSRAIRLSLLARVLLLLLDTKLLLVLLEELGRFGWVLAGHIVECGGGDVVGLAFSDKRVVLEKILKLRWVQVGLCLQNLPGFGPADS